MISPRREIQELGEAVHGAADRTELISLGIDPGTILDFSASVNPFGPSPRVVEALTTARIDTYPDRDATEFRETLATHLDLPLNCLMAGNGSSEILNLIVLAYFRRGDTVLVVGPTYSEYARVSLMMGARVEYCDASPQLDFEFPSVAVANALHALQPRAVFLCHPNNPTGQAVPADELRKWIDDYSQTLFVVDEAYIEFATNAPSFARIVRDNLIVLRSMTKAYGLAGLRLGYAVSSPDVINILCRVRTPWSVNSLAQAAGAAALKDEESLKRSVATLRLHKDWLVNALTSSGQAVCPSATHFFLVRVDNASEVRRQLLESKILVRDCASFGLPDMVRISPRSDAENAVLYAELLRFAQSKS